MTLKKEMLHPKTYCVRSSAAGPSYLYFHRTCRGVCVHQPLPTTPDSFMDTKAGAWALAGNGVLRCGGVNLNLQGPP